MDKQKEVIKTKTQMREPKKWNKIESPNFFKFEKIGDSIEGLLMDKDISNRYGFGLYTIRTFKGEQIRFHGSSQLDDLMLTLDIPCYARITFIDEQNTPNGVMKLFEVFKGSNQ